MPLTLDILHLCATFVKGQLWQCPNLILQGRVVQSSYEKMASVCSHHSVALLNALPAAISDWLNVTQNSLLTLKALVLDRQREHMCRLELLWCAESGADGLIIVFLLMKVAQAAVKPMKIWSDKSMLTTQSANWAEELSPVRIESNVMSKIKERFISAVGIHNYLMSPSDNHSCLTALVYSPDIHGLQRIKNVKVCLFNPVCHSPGNSIWPRLNATDTSTCRAHSSDNSQGFLFAIRPTGGIN